MELNGYDIIKKPVITSKSIELYKKLGKITFEVHKLANKIIIKNAVEKIWNVQVASVCVANVTGKVRTFARKKFKTSDFKKAIVTLKKGYRIEIPGMFESVESAGAAETEKEGT